MKATNYQHFFENFTKDTTLCDYEAIFDKNVYFKDPFHEFHGIDKLYALFQSMFRKLEKPNFKVIYTLENGNTLFIKWSFSYKSNNKFERFEGMSHVLFNDEGKAISHIDYWDAASNIYEKLPLIGGIVRFFKQQVGKL